MRSVLNSFIVLFLFLAEVGAAVFYNPVVNNGADPWIIQKNGFYYYTHTTGNNVRIRKAQHLTGSSGIGNAFAYTVFTPSPPNNQNVWAPELHFLQGKWYIYFAADNGVNANHRMFVAESDAADPITSFVSKGKIFDSSDRWAIDGTVLEKDDGSLFFIWSGWPGAMDGLQNLYIAPMSNPWTISGPRVLISTPTYGWEGWINEGPQIMKRNGKIFIVYSANASWTDNYCFGLLTNTDGNVLNPASWTKHPQPVFSTFTSTNGSVFGPGHGSFTKSVDGTEDWLVYHAAKSSGSGWDRNVRIQPFGWNPDDSPNFGTPIPINSPLNVPSGEGNNTLTLNSTLGGFASKSPDQPTYVQNQAVTLTATTAPGYQFIGWEGDIVSLTNPLTIQMNSDKTVTAVFTNGLILPPTITKQPDHWSGFPGETASFNVAGTGTAPFFYQWRINGTNISGATTASYQRSNVVAADAGYYCVIVSNVGGSVTSSNAMLSVQLPMTFHSVELLTNGILQMKLGGTFGSTNVIEISTNLVEWTVLTNIHMSGSTVEFSDLISSAQRFYRTADSPSPIAKNREFMESTHNH